MSRVFRAISSTVACAIKAYSNERTNGIAATMPTAQVPTSGYINIITSCYTTPLYLLSGIVVVSTCLLGGLKAGASFVITLVLVAMYELLAYLSLRNTDVDSTRRQTSIFLPRADQQGATSVTVRVVTCIAPACIITILWEEGNLDDVALAVMTGVSAFLLLAYIGYACWAFARVRPKAVVPPQPRPQPRSRPPPQPQAAALESEQGAQVAVTLPGTAEVVATRFAHPRLDRYIALKACG